MEIPNCNGQPASETIHQQFEQATHVIFL